RAAVSAARNNRRGRRPARGTWWQSDAWPGSLLRMRTPRRRRPGLLSEPGRGFCQYLALFAQHPYLAAQPIEFFALGRGQAVAAQSFIESSLLDPLADRLHCRFGFTCQPGNTAPAARQFNDSTPVFRCVWWMDSGHLENSFSLSPTPSTKLGQLQGVIGIPR